MNMTEWLEPETLEKLVRLGPSVMATLSKLKQMFPKGRGTKRDLKKLGEEIDELAKSLEKVCEVIATHMDLNTKLAQASLPFITEVRKRISELGSFSKSVADYINRSNPVLIAHETRIKALEASIAKGKSKKGSRSAGIPAIQKKDKRKNEISPPSKSGTVSKKRSHR